MATIARPPSGLEVSAPSDAMDVHSDSGYDLGDGDIDFEFESTAVMHHQDDDDVSLHDVAPDAELDLPPTVPEQDDFMADKDDVIEEDEIEYDDVEVTDADQHSFDGAAVAPETVDEDLIDYSDEEDGPQAPQEGTPHVEHVSEIQDAPAESVILQPNSEHDPAETLHPTTDEPRAFQDRKEGSEYGHEVKQSTDQSWDEVPKADWQQDANDEYNVEPLLVDAQIEHDEQRREVETHEHEENTGQIPQLEEQIEKDQVSQVVEQDDGVPLHLHPVTINYDGSEFWLFKPDSEKDEDWLLEDRSVQKGMLNQLFQACRLALQSDISNETELGFRFEHFHNMEIFEDSTACCFVNLNDLIDTYLKLHAQDNVTNPESFYITLQFRPRVMTLLGELKKAVRDKTGFAGLSTAVASGQTAFNTSYSNAHTDEANEDWDEEGKSDHQDDFLEQDEQQEDAVGIEAAAFENEQIEQHSESHSAVTHTDHVETHSSRGEEPVSDLDTHRGVDAQEVTATPNINAPTPATKYPVEDEGDVIDYSDDDEEEESPNVAQPGQGSRQASFHGPSSASSTVQGDDVAYTNVNLQGFTNHTEPHEDITESGYGFDEGLDNRQGAHDLHDEQDSHLGLDADFPNYEETASVEHSAFDDQAFNEEYSQGYDQDVSGQDFEARDYSAQDANTATAGYYYEEAAAELQKDLDFGKTAEGDNDHSVSNQAVGDDNFADLDGTFDFDGDDSAAAETGSHTSPRHDTHDVIEDDHINYDDDEDAEDGTVEQPTVASSAAAQPNATSSTGPDHEGSPQGLKRSIDEVGNALDVGTGSSDTKRPRV